MLIAKIENNEITEIADHKLLFPNTSFGVDGIVPEFLTENSCLLVEDYIDHDRATQKLVFTVPYILDNKVYRVVVEAKTGEELAAEQAQKYASQVVTMRQARLALLQQDLLDQVEAAVAAMPDPDGKAARITWEYAGEVRRGDALVQGLAQSFGWTDQQLDALFELAAQL